MIKIDSRALEIAWQTFKFVDPKVNESEMKAALKQSIIAYLEYLATNCFR